MAAFPNNLCNELIIVTGLLGQVMTPHPGVLPHVVAAWRIRQRQDQGVGHFISQLLKN